MLLDLQLDARPDRSVERARALVDAGAAGLFTFEGPHDVMLPLAAVAGQVETDLMTNVAIAMPRSPMHLAHAAWDLQVMSRGRFRLGLGSQIRPHIEKRYGATWSAPAARMREIVLAVRAILNSWQDGTPLDFRGEHTRHTLMPKTFVPGPNPYGPPPVLLGALGPLMTRTAAEVADGLLVMPFHSHRHFRERTLPAVAEGLKRAGRNDFPIYPQAIVAMGRTDADMAAASFGVRGLLAFYASTPAYRPVLDIEGWGELQPELNALSKTGDIMSMVDRICEDMLATIAVRGTPEECAEEIARRFGDVAERVCCYFPGYDPPIADIGALAQALRRVGPARKPCPDPPGGDQAQGR
ncbi:TIGR03617 family F420-dependent LLM class oxidoreductase [Nocardia cyriacigeorgica]|uniref:TIGR03617 family F420-dependent LLM class oxidoreductase n=1 Tax=Nocardia cyriacigeorgica TaxID=135487 RepID=UPI00189544A5|nr:TIGR03617 family F420-dependent LLM class oxidoreductase [Nocardia cyriacigeorgica]MBF6086613.1 TIGR03617 family F420-dependent LLM class oxidoreductase [Nocardia cyriacigeorgica]MBF6091073.1 TIGR03617 family F420-dependent LLM class oxidoreductase [Nocardia cyriacigeorgica]MBF6497778.1 TIGR03617 family F420-dependent LLM class oxidoreductase [Nocardia cyriacigeorgica]